MPYFDMDTDDDSSSFVALSCASFVLQDLDSDSIHPADLSSPRLLASAPINEPHQDCVAIDTDGGDDVQALIRKVEMESLKGGKVDHRRDSAFLSLRLFAPSVADTTGSLFPRPLRLCLSSKTYRRTTSLPTTDTAPGHFPFLPVAFRRHHSARNQPRLVAQPTRVATFRLSGATSDR